jgi:transcription termination factor Rho
MSVGSQALERSALESKDRDSLVQIATAMGGKPGSRAKKADIIDQILELAGVTTAAEEPSTPPEPTPEVEAADGAETDRAEAADDAPEAADASGDQADDAGDGEHGGGQLNGSGPREETESGNRRRRRRGRDRNRETQPAGAPTEESWQGDPVEVAGLLDLRDEGYGFLRLNGYLPSRDDVYVSVKQVRQFGLRKGDHLKGASRPAARNEKNPALLRIDEVNGADPETNRERPRFDELTAVLPTELLRLERDDEPDEVVGRVVDLVAPVGKGQRGLIVVPPEASATPILKALAQSVEANHPDVKVVVVLVDERPEEVTDLTRSIGGEVVASTFDRPAEEHAMVADLALERAKRLVEDGHDVVVIANGLTRLARAHNLSGPTSGRLVAGGIDAGALHPPKRFFGAARNVEEGGSLTILATLAVDGESSLDDAIADALVGTENSVLRLDADLAERRVWPPIDVDRSSTRHEDQLLDDDELAGVVALRRELVARRGTSPDSGLEWLLERLAAAPTNKAVLADLSR